MPQIIKTTEGLFPKGEQFCVYLSNNTIEVLTNDERSWLLRCNNSLYGTSCNLPMSSIHAVRSFLPRCSNRISYDEVINLKADKAL